ncbi:MAG: hypothetical protein LUF04_10345 [Bacteroides sp.]|nr:hypothetical protein [Bacteroides sp.]
MNKEDYLFLRKFESNFKTVEESGYSRAIKKNDRQRIKEIIQNHTGTPFTENIHCSSCLVKLFQTVKLLFDEGITEVPVMKEKKEEEIKNGSENEKTSRKTKKVQES